MKLARGKFRLSHDARVLLFALLAGLPAVLTCIILLATGGHSGRGQWTINLVIVLFWLGFSFAARGRVAGPLRTLANLLEAMREGDYSIRGRVDNPKEPMGEVMLQVNAMAATLRDQRLGALEATALLRKVMEEIDIAAFAFDPHQALRLVNRAGERLLAQAAERLIARDATSLGLAEYLVGEPEQTIQRSFAGASGRWGIRRSQFREGGLPHQLLVITDLTRPLREEELQAWQRLVRVLGHELNNSLTPIMSIATSLSALLQRTPRADDWEEDMIRGLNIIATRNEGLSRFLGAYARLAKLPRPRFDPVDVQTWVARIAELEHRVPVIVQPGEPIQISGDADQLDQLLINLIRNAADA